MTGKSAYRIGIVDNDAMVLRALAPLLADRLRPDGMEIIWSVRSGEEAVHRCVDADSRPDLVLVDMGMDEVDGAMTCRRIRAFSGRIVLLAMTAHSLNLYRDAARCSGAQALLDKADADGFVARIRACAAGQPYVESGFSTPGEAHAALCGTLRGRSRGGTPGTDAPGVLTPPAQTLSAKESEVMDWCIQGYTSREVAERLGLTESTVKTHIRHAIAKLGVRNKLQAVQRWTSLRAGRTEGSERIEDDGRTEEVQS